MIVFDELWDVAWQSSAWHKTTGRASRYHEPQKRKSRRKVLRPSVKQVATKNAHKDRTNLHSLIPGFPLGDLFDLLVFVQHEPPWVEVNEL
jgi:hypothetical protein